MKIKNMFQRLCLFLLLMASALGAWAEQRIVRFNADDYSRGKSLAESPLQKDGVTISFRDAKVGRISGDNLFELYAGGEMIVEAPSGYRIREILCKQGVQRDSYLRSEGGGYEVKTRYEATRHNSFCALYQFDAPASRVVAHPGNRKDCTFRYLQVTCVKVPNLSFPEQSYSAYVGRNFNISLRSNGNTAPINWQSSNANVASVSGHNTDVNTCVVQPKTVGKTTLTATVAATKDYAKSEASVEVTVQRGPLTITPNNLPELIFTQGSSGYNLYDHLTFATKTGQPFDKANAQFSLTCDNRQIFSACDARTGQLTYGAAGGKVTVTLTLKANESYDETSFSHTFTVIRSDKDGAVLIKNLEEYKNFVSLVNDKGMNDLNAKMTADVNLGGEIVMVGTEHQYAGTFDGQGHTLSFDWDRDGQMEIAPFYSVTGATIKNLRTKGKIQGKSKLAGLILYLYGNTTVSGCVSEVDIKGAYSFAGMINEMPPNAKVTMTDCVVKGDLTATTVAGKIKMGGFIHDILGNHNILTNCLYIGTNNSTEGDTFDGVNSTVTNCYYLNPCGKVQGTQITEEQLKNGYVAHQLQKGRDTQFWGQVLGQDESPLPTTDAAKRVYKVEFIYKDKVLSTHFVNSGKTVQPPSVKDVLGNDYNPHHYYTLTFGEGFSATTPVMANQQVKITLIDKEAFEIASKEDWKQFCALVKHNVQKALDAKMTADVNLGNEIVMVGEHGAYAGTFDGQGHTLTVNWDDDSDRHIAPFCKIGDGATIKNLRTQGKIQGNDGLAGLIASVYGNTTVSGCVSEVDIKGTYHLAGMIFWFGNFGKVTMTDCVVKGTLTATTEEGKKKMAGFIYFYGDNTLTNCLYIGTNNATGGQTFGFARTFTNCYYLNPCGEAQGTKITEEQLKSGEVIHLLQGDRTESVWGQEIKKDDYPQLSSDAGKRVYKVGFTYKDKEVATRYANSGKTVVPPTLQELLGNDYNPHHYYTHTFAEGFNSTTPVTADKQVAVNLTDKETFEIASKEDWKALRDLVNNGQTAVDAKLTKNVDLGTEIVMVADTWPNRYSGTFDGQGHTLSFDWDGKGSREIAPFKYVKDATIRNLHTQGKIKSATDTDGDGNLEGDQLSGLVHNAEGATTISSCVSEVELKAVSDLAGILQWPDGEAHVIINDCLVKGTFHATRDKLKAISGFIVHMPYESTCTLNNCLYLGTTNALSDDISCHTFCSPNGSVNTFSNCYYLNPCGKAQGTQASLEELESGVVAKKLQADRTDACYWAQKLGEMPSLYCEADKSKTNYVYWDTDRKQWSCRTFETIDYTPVGLDVYAYTANVNRRMTTGKAHTLTLPFDWAQEGKAYSLSSVDKSQGVAYFREMAEGEKCEAYKPYLFVPAVDIDHFGGGDIIIKAEPETPIAEEKNGMKWCATYAGMSNAAAAAANAYILQSDGLFHKVATDNAAAVIPPYRAYLTPSKGSQTQAFSIGFGDGTVTGLRALETTDRDGTVRYYDLNGRYIGTSLEGQPRGVYLGNGKKVMNK